MIMDLLAGFNDVALPLIDVSGQISLGWLENIIGWIVAGVGITGLGIILYCLILKIVVLPLDVWQKVSMRKQNLKMKSMRSQLEKLQQQYANTPDVYQRKVQEIYKQNGYNMFSSCLPMIATLVILIFAFQSLTTYSQHMNLEVYSKMSKAYNTRIESSITDDVTVTDFVNGEDNLVYVKTVNNDATKFVYKIENVETGYTRYYIDVNKMVALPEYSSLVVDGDDRKTEENCLEAFRKDCRNAASDTYYSERQEFLWIKNIFLPDVAWAHPLQKYNDFISSINKDISLEDGTKVKIKDFISENTYNEITANLTEEKSQPNGFFVLVLLTILSNLASQFIISKSQKDQRELQTVDQSAQQTQKWMMYLMPLLFCVFAFIYSAAFSLYLITSSLFSLLSTVVVNAIIDKSFNKKQAEVEVIKNKGRQAFTRNWAENERIRKEQEMLKGNNKNNKKRK